MLPFGVHVSVRVFVCVHLCVCVRVCVDAALWAVGVEQIAGGWLSLAD